MQELSEVVVQAQLQRTSATVSTYIPTSKQKSASQTGTDLINRIGIPQLQISVGDNAGIKTVNGQEVSVFIDFLPASSADKTVLNNPHRWNWKGDRTTLHSHNYSFTNQTYSSTSHCYIQLSATYTLGFGKKVQVGNEVGQQKGVSSGILK